MRVLLISHTCQSRTEGQPKAARIGATPGVELMVVVPNRWKHYGAWRTAEAPVSDSFAYRPTPVRLPWVGPAQYYLHTYPALSDILASFKPDVIDLWEEPWARVSAVTCGLRDRICPGARVVVETEQNICKRLPFPFEGYRAKTLARADRAIARSREAANVLRAKGFSGPIDVVPNGVDADLFRPLDRERCRRDLGLSGFVAGYVGRLVEEKGVLDLVAALPHCPPDVNLLFVGTGPAAVPIRAMAAGLGFAGRVRVESARPLGQLPVVMNALDVLVLPSRTTARWKEQFGRVIVEAHACGVPVVGSNSGAIPEVVGAGGLITPEADPAALARALARFAAAPTLARAMGSAGRRQALAHFTWDRTASRMVDVYRAVMSGGRVTTGASREAAAAAPAPAVTTGVGV